jgi:superfamily II DNA or RNA helicase
LSKPIYGSDNGITRGLIFCSRKKEAIELSTLFNLKGLKTVALTGDSTELERAKAIEKLESDSIQNLITFLQLIFLMKVLIFLKSIRLLCFDQQNQQLFSFSN